MKRVLLARPTYGGIDPIAAKALSISMMTAAQHHVAWVGDISYDRYGWSKTRNLSHSASITYPEADGVLWVDDDMVPDVTSIAKLIAAEKDFVSALCFNRRPPYKPTFAVGNLKDGYKLGAQWPEDSLMPVDAFGFAFVYTSMDLILAVGPNPFSAGGPRDAWTPGEDYMFCARAVKKGFLPWVDTGCHVGHLGDPRIIDQRDFELHRGTYRAADTLPLDVDPPKPHEVESRPPRTLGSKPELVN